MKVHSDETSDTVSFTDFQGKESVLFFLIIKYLKDNGISYINPSNTVVITRFDFDKIKELLATQI